MKSVRKPMSWILLWSAATAGLAVSGLAAAQENPPIAPSAGTSKSAAKPTAQTDAGEPRANTSPPAPDKAEAASKAPAPKAGQKPGAVDRLQLNTATVTGDREQPKVMYIVPWKSSDIGDLSGKPMNSLLDEALAPVDRDEFKREVVYFNAVKADRSQNGTSDGTPKQGEK